MCTTLKQAFMFSVTCWFFPSFFGLSLLCPKNSFEACLKLNVGHIDSIEVPISFCVRLENHNFYIEEFSSLAPLKHTS